MTKPAKQGNPRRTPALRSRRALLPLCPCRKGAHGLSRWKASCLAPSRARWQRRKACGRGRVPGFLPAPTPGGQSSETGTRLARPVAWCAGQGCRDSGPHTGLHSVASQAGGWTSGTSVGETVPSEASVLHHGWPPTPCAATCSSLCVSTCWFLSLIRSL